MDLLRQTANVAPIFPLARYSDGFAALKHGHYQEAISGFREAFAADLLVRSEAISGAAYEGRVALRQGRLPEALAHLKVAVESSPEVSDTRRSLGMAYWADD